ncbi:hypothetical protein [Virgibacillus proomii]|uniref:hypothetical protein n=1 Tax=Virgibacillus proomii TaxID=84407 RepID=UPI001C119A1F|nr:hypothetical protein [Virgibacillus proomii]MBU5266672.1 hypothetical protein [Virgibacillus proomii]
MEILFLLLIAALIVYLGIGLFIPSLINVSEEDIGENLQQLKKYQWFKNYLSNEKYKKLIVHNKNVRKTIGRFKLHKLDRESYLVRCQKKMNQILIKELNSIT